MSPSRCRVCGEPLEQPPSRGRPRKTCSDAHRQALSRGWVWPQGLEQAEERVVRLVAAGEAPSWLAVEQLAAGWRAAT